MRKVSVDEVIIELSRLLDEVEAGERITITRAGKPIALLSPFETVQKRKLGQFLGQAKLRPDFDELLLDLQTAFDGEST